MKKLTIIIFLFILSGCVSTEGVISDSVTSQIPEKANKVVLWSNLSADSLFNVVQKQLVLNGYRLANVNEEVLATTTEGKDIGQSTIVRFQFVINKEMGRLIGRASWSGGTGADMMASMFSGVNVDSKWMSAEWSTDGRPKRAFAALISFMQKIPHTQIGYFD